MACAMISLGVVFFQLGVLLGDDIICSCFTCMSKSANWYSSIILMESGGGGLDSFVGEPSRSYSDP